MPNRPAPQRRLLHLTIGNRRDFLLYNRAHVRWFRLSKCDWPAKERYGIGVFQMGWAMFVVRAEARFYGDKSPTTNPFSTKMKRTRMVLTCADRQGRVESSIGIHKLQASDGDRSHCRR
jgi:hypothetical protein